MQTTPYQPDPHLYAVPATATTPLAAAKELHRRLEAARDGARACGDLEAAAFYRDLAGAQMMIVVKLSAAAKRLAKAEKEARRAATKRGGCTCPNCLESTASGAFYCLADSSMKRFVEGVLMEEEADLRIVQTAARWQTAA